MPRNKSSLDDVFEEEHQPSAADRALDEGWDDEEPSEAAGAAVDALDEGDDEVDLSRDVAEIPPSEDVPATLPAVEGTRQVLFDTVTRKVVAQAGPNVVSLVVPEDGSGVESAVHSPIVLNGTILGTPAEILAATYKLARASEEALPALVKHCLAVARLGVPQAYGYQGLKGVSEFLDIHLKMSYRTFRYYVAVAAFCERCDIDDDTIRELGWGKLAEMTKVPVERVDGMIEYAREHTISQVREAAQALIPGRAQAALPLDESQRDPEGVPLEALHIALPKEQVDFVKVAMTTMSRKAKVRESEALSLICTEWAQTQGYEVPGEVREAALQRRLQELQQVYGVKLAVVEE